MLFRAYESRFYQSLIYRPRRWPQVKDIEEMIGLAIRSHRRRRRLFSIEVSVSAWFSPPALISMKAVGRAHIQLLNYTGDSRYRPVCKRCLGTQVEVSKPAPLKNRPKTITISEQFP